MRRTVQTTLFALFICLVPAMALAQNGSSAADPNTIESQAVDQAQVRESNLDTIEIALFESFSQTLDGLTDSSDVRFMGGGICSRLMPQFTCVAYDGNQGGLCPPICHAPGGGCGSCEQDFGGTCHCFY